MTGRYYLGGTNLHQSRPVKDVIIDDGGVNISK